MKTPRQLLLDHHREADVRLRNIQQAAIAESLPNVAKRMECAPLAAAFLCNVTNELFLPARRIWLGYAFIWIIVAFLHFTTSSSSPLVAAKAPISENAIATWREQQMILAELMKPTVPPHEPADRPKRDIPRTELQKRQRTGALQNACKLAMLSECGRSLPLSHSQPNVLVTT